MSSPILSVIIPVYNVAAYIEQCARSVFEQTLDDIEILFVDDCSPDNSTEIIERILSEYPDRLPLTRIIKMPSNSGQASVRRRGIIEATGDYIIHLDGDDWVDSNYYRSLYAAAIDENADVVIGDEVMEFPNKVVPKHIKLSSSVGKTIIQQWHRNTIGLFCHNKLVKRSLYTDNGILPWNGLDMWEDNGLFARLLYHAEKVVQVHGPVYHYNRCNIGAMTAGYGTRQVDQMIAVAGNLADFFNSKSDSCDFEKTVNAFKYLSKLNLITDSFAGYRKFKHLFPESDSITHELDRKAFSNKGRLRFDMVRYGFASIFICMFKVKKLIFRQ